MKKLLLIIIGIICLKSSDAQSIKKIKNQEIRFNVPLAIYGLPELSYERIVEENMGLGVSLSFAVDKPRDYMTDKGIPERWIICSYYRLYFGEKQARGFYVEGNMALASQKELNGYDYLTSKNLPSRTTTGFGFGAALGVKLITKNGYVGDFYAGWGRLFGDNIYNSYPRLGICLGKRY